jgi:molybdopterin converting factor subunit 1
MQVTVLFFAQARERTGRASSTLELRAGSRVADALGMIAREHPALEALWPHLAVAVDGTLSQADTPLAEGAEIALLPPVSGG